MLFIIRLVILVIFFNISKIVYIDESGVHQHYRRDKARAKRGVKIHAEKPGKRTRKINVIAGLRIIW